MAAAKSSKKGWFMLHKPLVFQFQSQLHYNTESHREDEEKREKEKKKLRFKLLMLLQWLQRGEGSSIEVWIYDYKNRHLQF